MPQEEEITTPFRTVQIIARSAALVVDVGGLALLIVFWIAMAGDRNLSGVDLATLAVCSALPEYLASIPNLTRS